MGSIEYIKIDHRGREVLTSSHMCGVMCVCGDVCDNEHV